MSRLPVWIRPLNPELTEALHWLKLGQTAAATVELVTARFPELTDVTIESAVAQAQASLTSGRSINDLLSGGGPAYAAPPPVPGVPSGVTRVEIVFNWFNPVTDRWRHEHIRQDFSGALDASQIRQRVAAFLDDMAARYAFKEAPVAVDIQVVEAVTGPS